MFFPSFRFFDPHIHKGARLSRRTGGCMEIADQIKAFHDFFEAQYYAKLVENVRKGEPVITVDFSLLSQFSLELADDLLEHPDDAIKAAELALARFDFGVELPPVRARLYNLPESQRLKIKNIRSKHLNKLVQIQGIVRQKTDVRPQVTSARFECPSCGNIINVLQLDTKFKEPTRCGCGRKGKFLLLSKELVDAQKIVLEEAPEDLEGGEQPKRLDIFLKNDLVSPLTERRTNPGSKVVVVGAIKEVPIPSREGGILTRYDLIAEANYIESVFEEFSEISLSPEDLQAIQALGRDGAVYEKIVASMAPSIFGLEKIKEALLLQLMGGVRKVREDGVSTRGDIHILLIGDPGAGKSQLLKRITMIAPKSRFVSGKGASGAGLTASVVRDEFLRGWALEAGALVLANRGLACIDELDKMSTEDRSAMHEALEQQTVTISKANIQATLRAETTVLAAANPKFGRFDPYEPPAKQLDLPTTLLSRFDLIFPIRDLPDPGRDERLAGFILKLHQSAEALSAPLETAMLKKYIAYAKQFVAPQISEEALEEIKEYFVRMRSQEFEEGSAIRTVSISARQLEGLVRLSEASARTRLAPIVTRDDAKRAVELLHFCLSSIGMDPESGKIDIDRITTGISATQRSQIAVVRSLIQELEAAVGKVIPLDDLLKEAAVRGIPGAEVEEVIAKLKQKGDIFEPRSGFLSRIQ